MGQVHRMVATGHAKQTGDRRLPRLMIDSPERGGEVGRVPGAVVLAGRNPH
jgi:hypothetical protein